MGKGNMKGGSEGGHARENIGKGKKGMGMGEGDMGKGNMRMGEGGMEVENIGMGGQGEYGERGGGICNRNGVMRMGNMGDGGRGWGRIHLSRCSSLPKSLPTKKNENIWGGRYPQNPRGPLPTLSNDDY
ncbi:hypothetical protein EDB89DRAFT_1912526 [Lactarius sanguifluus]|nr:hypothetical protein EDB89DRAFT_1912526 [Lactarius sanguifluus]